MESELLLDDIHNSVELALVSIRDQHEKVDAVFGDLPYLKRTVEKVLEPLNERAGFQGLSCLEDLRQLRGGCSRSTRPCTDGTKFRLPTPPSTGRPLVRALSDGRLNGFNSARFPAVLQLKKRSSSAGHDCFLLRERRDEGCHGDEVTLLPTGFRQTFRATHPIFPGKENPLALNKRKDPNISVIVTEKRERVLKIRTSRTAEIQRRREMPDIKNFELNRLIENLERAICVLQETFSSFTQRVLLPLQTFCKQCGKFSSLSKKERDNEMKDVLTDAVSLDKTEFQIVQTLNEIKQLLWSDSELKSRVHLFSANHFSGQVGKEIDGMRHPILRLVPDVLQKFNMALSLASLWLKRDIMYVRCTKLALLRSHQRFLKTERLWRQARDAQRTLRRELENVLSGLRNNSTRLETVQDEIEMFNSEMDKSNRAKKLLEEKLLGAENTVEPLVAKHRSLRKKSVILSAKLEARQRSREFLQSRVLSLKADQVALDEKLRINEEYAAKLQDKMEEQYAHRDAWSKRYEEKTEPEKLRSRLQSTKIRMPLPLLREKTFTLVTEEENVERAVRNMEQYLVTKKMHWSKLGSKLPWRRSLLESSKESLPIFPKNEGSGYVRFLEIEKRIVSTHPDDVEKQRSLMFRLWVEENAENEDTLDQLLRALKISDFCTLAESIERQIMRR